MKKMLIGLLGTLFVGSMAAAGDRVSNGGGAWVCRERNGTIRWAELVDLYEAREEFGLTVPKSSTPPSEQLDSALERVKTANPAFLYKLPMEQVQNSIQFIQANLVVIDDSLYRIQPSEAQCLGGSVAYEQVANYTQFSKILIKQDLFEALPNTDQAALYLHEAIYKLLRDVDGDTHSVKARKMVGHVFSTASVEELLPVIQSPGIDEFEDGPELKYSALKEGKQEESANPGPATQVVFSADGAYFAVPREIHGAKYDYYEGVLDIYETATGKIIGPTGVVTASKYGAISFGHLSHIIATSRGSLISVKDFTNGHGRVEFPVINWIDANEGPIVTRIALSPNDQYLAVTGDRSFAKVFNWQTKQPLLEVSAKAPDAPMHYGISQIIWSNDGIHLFIVDNAPDFTELSSWNVTTGLREKLWVLHSISDPRIQLSLDESRFYILAKDKVRTYETASGALLNERDYCASNVSWWKNHGLSLSPDGTKLLFMSDTYCVLDLVNPTKQWSWSIGKRTTDGQHNRFQQSEAQFNSNRFVATTSVEDGTVSLFKLTPQNSNSATMKPVLIRRVRALLEPKVWISAAVSPHQQGLLIGAYGNNRFRSIKAWMLPQ